MSDHVETLRKLQDKFSQGPEEYHYADAIRALLEENAQLKAEVKEQTE